MGKRISVQQLPKPILLKKFTELYGYSADAVKAKIRNGVWMEGREFCYSSDRKIQIIKEGYRRWAFSQSPTAQRTIQEGYFE